MSHFIRKLKFLPPKLELFEYDPSRGKEVASHLLEGY